MVIAGRERNSRICARNEAKSKTAAQTGKDTGNGVLRPIRGAEKPFFEGSDCDSVSRYVLFLGATKCTRRASNYASCENSWG